MVVDGGNVVDSRWFKFLKGLGIALLQCCMAGIILIPIALVLFVATGTFEGGFQAFFWLIYAVILCAVTIAVVLVLGLPLRIVARLWWRRHFWIPIVGVVLGAAALVVSFLPDLVETSEIEIDGVGYTAVSPVWWLVLIGWLVLAFSLVHLTVPMRRVRPSAGG